MKDGLVGEELKTIGSQMSQVLSRPCSNLERSRQRHGGSASLLECKREIFESTGKVKKLRGLWERALAR